MKATFFLLILLSFLSISCGEDSVIEQPETEQLDTTGTASPPSDTARETVPPANAEASEPVEENASADPSPSRSPASPDTSTRSDSPPGRTSEPSPRETSSLTGSYTLATVDGKPLPAVTDTRPGCRIEVLSGDVVIEGSDRFRLRTATRETCEERVTAEDVWEAAGTVEREGSALHFEGSTGDAFGAAEGRLDDDTITISSVSSEGGVEQVSWRFVRRGNR